ncbi:IS110 family transposase [Streptomyces mirabilis]|uniref:IS110 family transposase n=1 Tax=Streptomyces mirabilis TaxID=68239 RepID=UPI003669D557
MAATAAVLLTSGDAYACSIGDFTAKATCDTSTGEARAAITITDKDPSGTPADITVRIRMAVGADGETVGTGHIDHPTAAGASGASRSYRVRRMLGSGRSPNSGRPSMTSPYEGVQWVGMDLDRRRSVLVRMGSDARQLGTTVRFNNDPVRLKREIAKAGPRAKVVLEATLGWYWAADVLTEAGAEVHLAHPLGAKAFAYRRVTNDERDAVDLADLQRMGRLPEAWLAPPETRELRELVWGRHKLAITLMTRGSPDAGPAPPNGATRPPYYLAQAA